MQIVAIHLERVFELAISEQSVINEDTGLSLAYGFVNEHCGYRGIDSARESADHVVIPAHGSAYCLDLFRDKAGRSPVASASADAEKEIPKYLFAKWRVADLGVELDAIDTAFRVLDSGYDFASSRRRR